MPAYLQKHLDPKIISKFEMIKVNLKHEFHMKFPVLNVSAWSEVLKHGFYKEPS